MKLIKKLRKGFTLIELVVVIAVIAILAAISVISYLSITNKAKESNDHMVIDQVNTLVQGTSYQSRKATVHDLVSELDQTDGFDMRKIQPELQGTEFVYCFDENMFGYWKDEKVVYPKKLVDKLGSNYAKSDVWFFRDSVDSEEEHSIYLKATPTTKKVTTRGGLDVGDQKDIKAITLERPTSLGSAGGDLVIRTNGGTLTVDAASDTVHHYGPAEKVDIKAIANASYHEHDTVDLIAVKQGHVKLESGSDVLGIYVYNVPAANETVAKKFEEIKITVETGVEVPQLSRSAVEVQDEGTKVCTVVTDQSKDIYLFNEGIYEQIKAIDHIDPETENYAQVVAAALAESKWVDETDSGASENTQNAAWQLANEYNGRNSDGSISAETITIEETTYKVMLDNETRTFETFKQVVETDPVTSQEVVKDVKMSSSEIEAVVGLADQVEAKIDTIQTNVNTEGSSEAEAVADLPLRGDGLSWETAFEIYDYATMQKISDYFNVGKYFFKVAIEKTNNGHIDCSNWETVYLNGSFDGNGVILDNIDTYLFESNCETENSYILMKNFTANVNIKVGDSSNRAAALLCDAANETYFDNITVHGYITSTYVAVFMGWTNAGINSNIYINDCYSDAELAGTDGSAVIFAHAWTSSSDDRYIYMTDTLYEGIMSGNYHTFVTACSGGGAKNKEMYVTFNDPSMLSRFRNVCIAILAENTNDNGYQYQWCPGTDILNQSGYGTYDTITGVMGMKNYVRTSAIEVIYHNGSDLAPGELVSIAKNASASTWSARFEIGPNDKNGYGNYVSAYVGPSGLTNNNGTLTTTNIYACTVTVNGDATESTGYTSDYTKFNVVNNIYGTTFGSASITITQYDSNGRLVQMDVWDLTK